MLKLVLLSILMVHYGSAHTYHTGECPAVTPMPEFDMKKVRIIIQLHHRFCFFYSVFFCFGIAIGHCSWHLNQTSRHFFLRFNYCVNIIYAGCCFLCLLAGLNFIVNTEWFVRSFERYFGRQMCCTRPTSYGIDFVLSFGVVMLLNDFQTWNGIAYANMRLFLLSLRPLFAHWYQK